MNEKKEALRLEILKDIEKNSRVDLGELAVRLGVEEVDVANEMAEMENAALGWDDSIEGTVSEFEPVEPGEYQFRVVCHRDQPVHERLVAVPVVAERARFRGSRTSPKSESRQYFDRLARIYAKW